MGGVRFERRGWLTTRWAELDRLGLELTIRRGSAGWLGSHENEERLSFPSSNAVRDAFLGEVALLERQGFARVDTLDGEIPSFAYGDAPVDTRYRGGGARRPELGVPGVLEVRRAGSWGVVVIGDEASRVEPSDRFFRWGRPFHFTRRDGDWVATPGREAPSIDSMLEIRADGVLLRLGPVPAGPSWTPEMPFRKVDPDPVWAVSAAVAPDRLVDAAFAGALTLARAERAVARWRTEKEPIRASEGDEGVAREIARLLDEATDHEVEIPVYGRAVRRRLPAVQVLRHAEVGGLLEIPPREVWIVALDEAAPLPTQEDFRPELWARHAAEEPRLRPLGAPGILGVEVVDGLGIIRTGRFVGRGRDVMDWKFGVELVERPDAGEPVVLDYAVRVEDHPKFGFAFHRVSGGFHLAGHGVAIDSSYDEVCDALPPMDPIRRRLARRVALDRVVRAAFSDEITLDHLAVAGEIAFGEPERSLPPTGDEHQARAIAHALETVSGQAVEVPYYGTAHRVELPGFRFAPRGASRPLDVPPTCVWVVRLAPDATLPEAR